MLFSLHVKDTLCRFRKKRKYIVVVTNDIATNVGIESRSGEVYSIYHYVIKFASYGFHGFTHRAASESPHGG